jgi:hypothetical protein
MGAVTIWDSALRVAVVATGMILFYVKYVDLALSVNNVVFNFIEASNLSSVIFI